MVHSTWEVGVYKCNISTRWDVIDLQLTARWSDVWNVATVESGL